jgi:hypothetical protein
MKLNLLEERKEGRGIPENIYAFEQNSFDSFPKSKLEARS